MKETEGHYYVCEKCGCFYKVINGKQIRQDKAKMRNVTEVNFHAAENHKCIKQQIEHGVNKKRKVNVNMDRYSRGKNN